MLYSYNTNPYYGNQAAQPVQCQCTNLMAHQMILQQQLMTTTQNLHSMHNDLVNAINRITDRTSQIHGELQNIKRTNQRNQFKRQASDNFQNKRQNDQMRRTFSGRTFSDRQDNFKKQKLDNIIPIMIMGGFGNKTEPKPDTFVDVQLPDQTDIRTNISSLQTIENFEPLILNNLDDIVAKGKEFTEKNKNHPKEEQDSSQIDDFFSLIINKEVAKNSDATYSFMGKKYSISVKKIMKLVKPVEILNSMVGMKNIKDSVFSFIAHFLQNESTESMLNTAIYGKPGVGKTHFGKILCMIYSALEIVPSQRFRLVKASELIGKYVGETRQKTKEVLDEAAGGVLFIDEAYSLMSGSGDKYSYGKECIDTLTQELSENHRKLVVIIAGYEKEIEDNFFKVNEGLGRRFPFRYVIKDYSKEELKEILVRMIRIEHLKLSNDVTDDDLLAIFDEIEYFDNCGGDIENLLINCKFANNIRSLGKHPDIRNVLTKQDLLDGYERFKQNKKVKDDKYLQMFT